MRTVAFLGLGVMGSGMAARLVEHGFDVVVWNRSRPRVDAMVAKGARAAATPEDAARHADAVVSMVADDQASRTAWIGEAGALAGARRDTLLVESSTLSIAWVTELAALAGERGCTLLDAPVTGSKTHAATGQLRFLAGGDAAVVERARPLLMTMGRDVRHVGPIGSGAMLKLINNFVCGVQGAALAEAIAMMERSGLDVGQAIAVLADGAPGSPLVQGLAPRMTASDYRVNFALALMRKDLTYAMEAASRLGVTLETAAAARRRYDAAVAAGHGDQDFAAVIEPLRP